MRQQLGERLRTWRRQRRLSLGDLAGRAGVATGTLGGWERGLRWPRLPELDAVLSALDVPLVQRHEVLALIDAPRARRSLVLLSPPLSDGVEAEHRDDQTLAVLADIFQTSAMEASHDAGGRLLEAMARVNVLQRPRVQQASFVVLKSASFPSVLVETAFLTNARDERLLGDPAYHDKLARSMLEGIKGYFKSYRPLHQVAQSGGGVQPVSLGATTAAR